MESDGLELNDSSFEKGTRVLSRLDRGELVGLVVGGSEEGTKYLWVLSPISISIEVDEMFNGGLSSGSREPSGGGVMAHRQPSESPDSGAADCFGFSAGIGVNIGLLLASGGFCPDWPVRANRCSGVSCIVAFKSNEISLMESFSRFNRPDICFLDTTGDAVGLVAKVIESMESELKQGIPCVNASRFGVALGDGSASLWYEALRTYRRSTAVMGSNILSSSDP